MKGQQSTKRSSRSWNKYWLAALPVAILLASFLVQEYREQAAVRRPVGTTHEDLRRQLIERSGQLDRVEVRVSPEHGGSRMLVATENVLPDETIFVVPRSMLLSAATFSGRGSLVSATRNWPQDPEEYPDMYVDAMVLMYERLKGNSSKWATYFHSLPNSNPLPYTDPSYNASARLAFLPALKAMATKRRQGLDDFFPRVMHSLRHLPSGTRLLNRFRNAVQAGTWLTTYFPRGFAPAAAPSPSGQWTVTDALRLLYTHSYACAKTRSVTEYNYHDKYLSSFIEQFGVMVPYFDFANHDSFDFNAEVVEVEGGIGLGAVRPIKEGDQITFSYRSEEMDAETEIPGCNWRWFVEYGLVLSDRPDARACYAGDVTAMELRETVERTRGTTVATKGLRRLAPYFFQVAGTGRQTFTSPSSEGTVSLASWIAEVFGIDRAAAASVALEWAEKKVAEVEGTGQGGGMQMSREEEIIWKGAAQALKRFRDELLKAQGSAGHMSESEGGLAAQGQ